MSFWESFWDIIWVSFVIFIWIAYLMVLFTILVDLFRDHELNGWWKALWIIFLIFVPLLTALVYLIARGPSMAKRQAAQIAAAQDAQESYIRQVATPTSPSDEIAKAKALHEAGTISDAEFALLKEKALKPETNNVA